MSTDIMANDIVSSTEVLSSSNNSEEIPNEYKVYKRRWLVLGLYSINAGLSGALWIQYSVIADVIMDYYSISSTWVDMTSMIFMIMYIIVVFPVSWFLDKYGLRTSGLIGVIGTSVGCWVKLLSVDRDLFWVGFLGHSITAIFAVFIMGQPARLAAVWFGRSQVSTACSIGVAGNQLGVAIGFLLPPIMVPNNDDKELVGKDLQVMFYTMAGLTTALSIFMIIFFSDTPPTPPSAAQDNIVEPSPEDNYIKFIKRLMMNKDYMLLLLSYGMNVAIFSAISTLLNQVVLVYYPGANEDVGRIGLVLVIAGMIGSVVFGIVLDRTHRFKETTIGLCAGSVVGMLIYTFTMDLGHIYVLYISSFILGFFMTGYVPVGFEYASEVTYPEPEGTVAGLLNASVQVFAVTFTFMYGYLIDSLDVMWANVVLAIVLIIGTTLLFFISSNLRRQAANKSKKTEAQTI